MSSLTDEIMTFLMENGISCAEEICGGLEVICARICDREPVKGSGKEEERIIVPLGISAETLGQARQNAETACEAIMDIKEEGGTYPLIITEDRWRRQREMMEARLLAHLEIFSSVFARNCEVRRIEKGRAKDFLKANHSYAYASCRYHYGLFTKSTDSLIAVATFSNARKWIKNGKEIRSYEWTRYASLPGIRISGGMGKLLKAFIYEVQPDDVMSYADLEWSEGKVYETLGFVRENGKEAVDFIIDSETWERRAVKCPTSSAESSQETGRRLFFRNFGSAKYRLKFTEYE